jgi:hypothetical protein
MYARAIDERAVLETYRRDLYEATALPLPHESERLKVRIITSERAAQTCKIPL